MKTEYEAKFLDIDINEMRKKLSSLGAECVHSERMMHRVVFESEYLQNRRAWLRVRNEGDVTKLTLKAASDATDITRIKEVEVSVADFKATVDLLIGLGLEQKRYQENKRESWRLGDISIELDSWPNIPPYIEIEAGSEEEVRSVSENLNFDYESAVFGSADEVYKNHYGIDILKMDRLIFEE